MLNKEKFAKEIVDIAIKGGTLAVVDGKPIECIRVGNCRQCALNPTDLDNHNCDKKRQEWADSEASDSTPIDWSKVPVDTPILVRDYEEQAWSPRYFCKYEDGRVYTWSGGLTSMMTNFCYSWRQAKLA